MTTSREETRSLEPWTSTWARRSISLPLYGALALISLLGAPIWLPLAAAIDLATRRRSLPRTRAVGFFATYLLCEVAGVLAATALWVESLGGRMGGRQRFVSRNAALQRWWTTSLFRAALLFFSMSVEVEGTEEARDGPFLLLVRHTSTADTVLAAALVANPARRVLRYVLKRDLLWDPCLDIVGQRLPNAFVSRRAEHRREDVDSVVRLSEGLDPASGVLIYPEGTRFDPAKLQSALNKLETQGNSQLVSIARSYRSVLPPRLAGTLALLDNAPGLDVVILEHTGFEGAASFGRFWSGELIGRTIRARIRRISAAQIPSEGRDVWLFQTWADVDRWVTATGPSETPAGLASSR